MLSLSLLQTYTNDHLNSLLRSMFKGVDFRGRFRVTRETDEYVKDSVDYHNIKTGKRKEYFSIYFDDEFMCSFTEDTNQIQADKLFLEGFLKAYETGQIYLTKGLYLEKEKERKQKEAIEQAKKEAERQKDFAQLSTEEKQIASQVMEEVEKEKGHAAAK